VVIPPGSRGSPLVRYGGSELAYTKGSVLLDIVSLGVILGQWKATQEKKFSSGVVTRIALKMVVLECRDQVSV
jgi:hypothetical protein